MWELCENWQPKCEVLKFSANLILSQQQDISYLSFSPCYLMNWFDFFLFCYEEFSSLFVLRKHDSANKQFFLPLLSQNASRPYKV